MSIVQRISVLGETAPHLPSLDSMLESARRIAIAARSRAGETEKLRYLPHATINDMREADLMRTMVPKEWGGMALKWSQFVELVYEMAQGCGATGWVYCVLVGHAQMIRDFPQQVQQQVWGDGPNALISSAFAPTGRAERVPGGYRLNGKFPFSSGSDHAQWAVVNGLVFDGPAPTPLSFLVPMSELTIVDDWHTVGLVGTGSKTLEAKEVIVSEDHVRPVKDFFAFGSFVLQSAMVGMATGAVKTFIETIRKKPAGRPGTQAPAQSELYYAAVGAASGEVAAAWDLLQQALKENEAEIERDSEMSAARITRNRAATALISRLCVDAVDRVYQFSGGQGIYTGPLSRAVQDVRAVAQHTALNAPMAARDAGLRLLTMNG